MNLLDEALIRTEGAGAQSLPGLLAAMAQGRVHGFPAMRPHQRPAWHMFLVQLAVLALRGQDGDLPREETAWRARLQALGGGEAGVWALVGPADRPAFLQPAVVAGLKATEVPTPDALDMLITAKNHDLKQRVARDAAPEDWIFALVSLQTMEGYGGRGNQGIARMNGGSSSRPLLGLAPAGLGAPDPSAWWRRDVERLRAEGVQGLGPVGGPALLWVLPWPEGAQLALTDLDPLFIEVCRRIRLETRSGRIGARRWTSVAARLDAKVCNGVTGDPWCPVDLKDNKSLTLGSQPFSYKLLSKLLWGNAWHLPVLARPGSGDGPSVLVAEALARGNSRTDGFMSRTVPVPDGSEWGSESAGTIARAQIEEIAVFDKALRDGLAIHAAGGLRTAIKTGHYDLTRESRARLDAFADAIFFDHLWARLAAQNDDTTREAFLAALLAAAEAELERGMAAIPCAAVWRPRAHVAAGDAFRRVLEKDPAIAAILKNGSRERHDAHL